MIYNSWQTLLQSKCAPIDFLKYWLAQFEYWESKERTGDCKGSIANIKAQINMFI